MAIFLEIIQMVLALVLIVVVSAQTTKSESGLSGAIGGKSSSSFHGRPGLDDQLSKITKWSAVGFMIVSVGVAIAVNKGL